jgi:phospholipid/cholesterol/gamma-HCH transport system substrate-binding protein
MMSRKIDFELKVGIFVFIGIIILTIIVFSISDFKVGVGGYYLKVIFNFAHGIEVGAPVRLAGVKVGDVKDISISYVDEDSPPRVELLIWIKSGIQIYSDSIAYINTLGLLGEKYLEIIPGSKRSVVLKEGEGFLGKDSVSMAQVTELGYQIASKIDRVISSLDTMLDDPEVKGFFKETLKNSQRLTEEFGRLSTSAWEILNRINRGEGTVGKLLSDEGLYNDLEGFVQDLKAHPWKLLYRPRGKK